MPYSLLIRAASPSAKRTGIYAFGSCDLRVILGCQPLIEPHLQGCCAIQVDGGIVEARSDLLLQTLQRLPRERVAPVVQRLRLAGGYFEPRLFSRAFVLPPPADPQPFEKNVVLLSIAPDVIRSVYRHRHDGLLVDPGGIWLNQPTDPMVRDPTFLTWFQEQFEPIGRISVDQFVTNFTEIIGHLKSGLGARVLVFNNLTVDPGGLVHNYQFVKNMHAMRRREFNLALVDLSRRLDFSIVDQDRVVKKAGIQEQVDFGHAPPGVQPFIAREVVRVLHDIEVF